IRSSPRASALAPSPLSPNSSAAQPQRKIFFPPSSPPSKPTPRSAKSLTPSAASSVNTGNPSSSNVECGSLAPAFAHAPSPHFLSHLYLAATPAQVARLFGWTTAQAVTALAL